MFELNEIFQDLNIVAIPTKTNFRGVNVREAALFRGSEGWSEFSPFVEYGVKESKTWLQASLEAAYKPWPKSLREKVLINATLPQVAIDEVPRILSAFPGAKTIKVKVDNFEKDNYLVEAALEFIPDAKIRLDVNGGWDFDTALLNLYNFHLRFGNVFEYIEQPCLELDDLAKLKKEVPIKIAVDESIRKALDTDLSVLKECADVAIIKWAPSGGFTGAQKLISAIGLPVVISSALDTGIGISHGLALAAAQPEMEFACGLGTTSLFVSDVLAPPLLMVDGSLEVTRQEPNKELLSKYQVSPERRLWWEERLSSILAQGGFDEYLN